MKILFIATLSPPITGQSLASDVLKEYLSSKYIIDEVNLSKENFQSGVATFKRFKNIFSILLQILKKVRNSDLIYFTTSESKIGNIKDWLIYLICIKKIDKLIIHIHGGAGMFLLMKNWFFFKINSYFYKKLSKIIILGETHKRIFENIEGINNKIIIIPNFAEDSLFVSENIINSKFKNLMPVRFLFLSNLITGKGYSELLDSYFLLNVELKKMITIDFAGGFENEVQKNKFITKIEGIENINYLGVVKGVEKIKLFKESHIYVLPTYYYSEGQPISILEAYASGCVVVTTDHSGIKDIFEKNVNGFEVEKKSPKSIAVVIQNILINKTQLLPIAITNYNLAKIKFRTSIYNSSLNEVILSVINNKK